MIKVPPAKDTYTVYDQQRMVDAIVELQKKLNALSEYVPQVDITTSENVKLVIDNGTVDVVTL